MTFVLSLVDRTAACDTIVDAVDVGGGGRLEIFTGPAPAATTDADSGIKLGTLTLAAPAFGAAVAGIATANAIGSDISADASGTAGHFRVKRADGRVIFQGACGVGTGELQFDSVTFILGGVVSITSFVVAVN